MKKKIVLFDLDGTLTPPRGSIDDETAQCVLGILHDTGARVGIVTGSDLPYVIQQLGGWTSKLGEAGLEVFSCNGTKHFLYRNGEWIQHAKFHEMREVLGPDMWRQLVTTLHNSQLRVMREHPDIPLTGNFISYRGSTLNWCPIGRDASEPDRQEFERLDHSRHIRVLAKDWLTDCLDLQMPGKVQVVLGGNTSFDIFVKGWDKTYVLKILDGFECWFVGDRCQEGGNDHTLYKALKVHSRAYETLGPGHTRKIIEEITKRITDQC